MAIGRRRRTAGSVSVRAAVAAVTLLRSAGFAAGARQAQFRLPVAGGVASPSSWRARPRRGGQAADEVLVHAHAPTGEPLPLGTPQALSVDRSSLDMLAGPPLAHGSLSSWSVVDSSAFDELAASEVDSSEAHLENADSWMHRFRAAAGASAAQVSALDAFAETEVAGRDAEGLLGGRSVADPPLPSLDGTRQVAGAPGALLVTAQRIQSSGPRGPGRPRWNNMQMQISAEQRSQEERLVELGSNEMLLSRASQVEQSSTTLAASQIAIFSGREGATMTMSEAHEGPSQTSLLLLSETAATENDVPITDSTERLGHLTNPTVLSALEKSWGIIFAMPNMCWRPETAWPDCALPPGDGLQFRCERPLLDSSSACPSPWSLAIKSDSLLNTLEDPPSEFEELEEGEIFELPERDLCTNLAPATSSTPLLEGEFNVAGFRRLLQTPRGRLLAHSLVPVAFRMAIFKRLQQRLRRRHQSNGVVRGQASANPSTTPEGASRVWKCRIHLVRISPVVRLQVFAPDESDPVINATIVPWLLSAEGFVSLEQAATLASSVAPIMPKIPGMASAEPAPQVLAADEASLEASPLTAAPFSPGVLEVTAAPFSPGALEAAGALDAAAAAAWATEPLSNDSTVPTASSVATASALKVSSMPAASEAEAAKEASAAAKAATPVKLAAGNTLKPPAAAPAPAASDAKGVSAELGMRSAGHGFVSSGGCRGCGGAEDLDTPKAGLLPLLPRPTPGEMPFYAAAAGGGLHAQLIRGKWRGYKIGGGRGRDNGAAQNLGRPNAVLPPLPKMAVGESSELAGATSNAAPANVDARLLVLGIDGKWRFPNGHGRKGGHDGATENLGTPHAALAPLTAVVEKPELAAATSDASATRDEARSLGLELGIDGKRRFPIGRGGSGEHEGATEDVGKPHAALPVLLPKPAVVEESELAAAISDAFATRDFAKVLRADVVIDGTSHGPIGRGGSRGHDGAAEDVGKPHAALPILLPKPAAAEEPEFAAATSDGSATRDRAKVHRADVFIAGASHGPIGRGGSGGHNGAAVAASNPPATLPRMLPKPAAGDASELAAATSDASATRDDAKGNPADVGIDGKWHGPTGRGGSEERDGAAEASGNPLATLPRMPPKPAAGDASELAAATSDASATRDDAKGNPADVGIGGKRRSAVGRGGRGGHGSVEDLHASWPPPLRRPKRPKGHGPSPVAVGAPAGPNGAGTESTSRRTMFKGPPSRSPATRWAARLLQTLRGTSREAAPVEATADATPDDLPVGGPPAKVTDEPATFKADAEVLSGWGKLIDAASLWRPVSSRQESTSALRLTRVFDHPAVARWPSLASGATWSLKVMHQAPTSNAFTDLCYRLWPWSERSGDLGGIVLQGRLVLDNLRFFLKQARTWHSDWLPTVPETGEVMDPDVLIDVLGLLGSSLRCRVILPHDLTSSVTWEVVVLDASGARPIFRTVLVPWLGRHFRSARSSRNLGALGAGAAGAESRPKRRRRSRDAATEKLPKLSLCGRRTRLGARLQELGEWRLDSPELLASSASPPAAPPRASAPSALPSSLLSASTSGPELEEASQDGTPPGLVVAPSDHLLALAASAAAAAGRAALPDDEAQLPQQPQPSAGAAAGLLALRFKCRKPSGQAGTLRFDFGFTTKVWRNRMRTSLWLCTGLEALDATTLVGKVEPADLGAYMGLSGGASSDVDEAAELLARSRLRLSMPDLWCRFSLKGDVPTDGSRMQALWEVFSSMTKEPIVAVPLVSEPSERQEEA